MGSFIHSQNLPYQKSTIQMFANGTCTKRISVLIITLLAFIPFRSIHAFTHLSSSKVESINNHHLHHNTNKEALKKSTMNTSSSTGIHNSNDDNQDNDTQKEGKGINLGFIGCGTIASSIATGLLTQTKIPISSVVISRRSESKSSALVQKFGDDIVTISDDNQSIVDNSDIIFLCVLPQQEEEVLSQLQISKEKTLISLVSTSNLETLTKNSKLPTDKVYKMICLPAVAQLEGTPLIVPPCETDVLRNLLSTLGGGHCIECDNEDIMESMMVTTAMMGPMYGLMRANREFLKSKGVPAKDASIMVGRTYSAIVKDALLKCDDENSLDDLIEEQTPGGLNEQTLKNLEGVGFLKSYEDAMESVLGRIKGKTDGTMINHK